MSDNSGSSVKVPHAWRPAPRWPWLLAAVGIFLAAAWARQIQAVWLVGAGVALAAAVAGAYRSRARARWSAAYWLATSVALLTVTVGVLGEVRFRAIAYDWADQVERREADLGRVLDRRLSSVVERGRRAATLAAEGAIGASPSVLFDELELLRERTGVDALAVFTHGGDLLAWAGDHRGRLPDAVRFGRSGTRFEERPLYSYLYFAAPIENAAQHVVAAVLVESGLVLDEEAGSFSHSFEALTGARPIFRPGGGGIWQLDESGTPVVHVTFEPVRQADERLAVERRVQRVAIALLLIAAVLLTSAWFRRDVQPGRLGSATPLLLAIPFLIVLPLGVAPGLESLFSPLLFVLPAGDATLGTVIVVLIAAAALVATLRQPALSPDRFGWVLAGGTVAVTISYIAGLRLLASYSSGTLMVSTGMLWFGLQVAATLLLGTVTALAMPRRRPIAALTPTSWSERRVELVVLGVALLLTLVLALTVMLRAQPIEATSLWTAALWAAPFLLAAWSLARVGGTGGRLLRWMVAGWLAASVAIPHLQLLHVGARLDEAERQLGTLGLQPDPYLDYLLLEFGRDAQERHAAAEDSVQLLYRTWVSSGMAQESYPVQAVLWDTADRPVLELALGDASAPDTLSAELREKVAGARATITPLIHTLEGESEVSRLLTVPFEDGRVLSVAVPPRRTLERTSVVAPFLGAVSSTDTRLSMIPARAVSGRPIGTHWVQGSRGWRSETLVMYPEGEYHAHLEVHLPTVGVRFARGVLIGAFDLVLLFALWFVGNAARGAVPRPRRGWLAWAGSFRARITIALFAFFLLPTAVFGWVAYTALAGEVARAAEMVAQRAVELAVLEFPEAEGNLRELAVHANTDVLYYYRGELADVSAPEALALGVYGAWMPPQVYRVLRTGEEASQTETRRIGDRPFLTAFRTLPPTGTLAVPMALSAGDTALRQRELAHLILFAALIGALLSLALSVAVGRALAGPIGQLRRASSAVGAGRLRVRLPDTAPGEFNDVFVAFNRMVRRLRRARTQELRTARVLAWGEMARQIAHEIKNPLTPIKLSVQHMRRAYNDGRSDFGMILDASVSQILIEIDRLTDIARAFSRYGAPAESAGPLQAVDVAAVAREALTLYRTADAEVSFRGRFEEGLPAVQARPGELKEVILNLLENARDALDGEGNVEVYAYQTDDGVALDVVDDGPGIPAELLTRVFEPHFSTRSTGTGLGLAIVRRLVESWGGTITAESEPGQGTLVHIVVPAAALEDSGPARLT